LLLVERLPRAFRAPRPSRSQRRLFGRIEPLEARMCPAVTFAFDAGVLTITGDEGPNAISLLHSADGNILATGDGQSQTFSDVDQVDQTQLSRTRQFTFARDPHSSGQ
jgi:hypothetical protein